MIMLVTLTRRPVRPMPGFTGFIEEKSRSFWKIMPNVWLVDSHLGTKFWTDSLQPHIRPEDFLFIVRVHPHYSGFLPQDAWDWLRTSAENGDFDEEQS